MYLRVLALPLLCAILAASAARGADAPAGSWKISLPGSITLLFSFEEKSGKWTGHYLGATIPDFPKAAVSDVVVTPDSFKFFFKIPGLDAQFDGKLPPDAKTGRISGSMLLRGKQMILTHLEASKLKQFDAFEFSKEAIESSTEASVLLSSAVDLITRAGEKKSKIEEVRGWADRAFKPAESYGLRWQRTVTLRLAQAASANKDYAPVAVEYARKAERLLDPDDDSTVQMEVLETVVQVLTKADKADDAKQMAARLAKLEERDLIENVKRQPFKPEPYEGRKSKSDRAVLVELFTNSDSDQCIGAEAALAALERTYKNTEAVVLQYHMHIRDQAPDPLCQPESMNRVQYYAKKFRGLPGFFVSGKPASPGGAPLSTARKKHTELREVIDPLLEKDAEVKLRLEATRKGPEITFKAAWSDAARTGEGLRLRIVLAESHVRFAGGSGARYHHAVVRAIPGGVKGVSLTKKAGEHTATINLDEVRTKLNEFMDEEEFSKNDRPLGLKNLRAIAFVQDDDSNDILQVVQIEVK